MTTPGPLKPNTPSRSGDCHGARDFGQPSARRSCRRARDCGGVRAERARQQPLSRRFSALAYTCASGKHEYSYDEGLTNDSQCGPSFLYEHGYYGL